MATAGANTEVKLTEIGGDIKLIRQSQEQVTRDMDRRDREHAAFSANVNTRLNGHSDRIRGLETKDSERVGMAKAVKWGYAAMGGGIGTVVIGGMAVAARLLGV